MKVSVDGCLVSDDTPRCDEVFEVGSPIIHAYYVEYKGTDIVKAEKQLWSTVGLPFFFESPLVMR